MQIEFIGEEFKLPPIKKTLKTKIKKGISLESAVKKAFLYVKDGNEENYNRVEFPFEGCYIVVAKMNGAETSDD